MSNICVIGSGSWGTALAIRLANNGNNVRNYLHNMEIERRIRDG